MPDTTRDRDAVLRGLLHEECSEYLEVLNRELLAAERSPAERTDRFKAIMRAIHSLKGSAAAVGIKEVEQLSHDWESCAAVAGASDATPSAGWYEALYAGLDAIQRQLDYSCGITGGGDAPNHGEAMTALRAQFGALTTLSAVTVERRVAPRDAVVDGAVVRIATKKLDRIMSGLNELLPLKVAGAERLRAIDEIVLRAQATQAVAGEAIRHFQRSRDASKVELSPVAQAIHAQQSAMRETIALALALAGGLRHDHLTLTALSDRFQDDLRSVRMVPVASVLGGLPRMVRDLARQQGKQIALHLGGADTELDRDVLEQLKDAVVHLVRNAVDHGIELPAQRQRDGKPAEGRIDIGVESLGNSLRLSIADDGGGIDADAVRRIALDRGIVTEADLASMDEDAVRGLIFRHGFSTADVVSEISGRGVGLDAVRDVLDRLGGRVEVRSEPGVGTTFLLTAPISLATARMVLFEAAGQLYAVPITAVERVVRVRADEVKRVEAGLAVELAGRPVRLFRLATVLGRTDDQRKQDVQPALLLSSLNERGAFLVDRILDEQELIVKGLGDHLVSVPNVAAATVLADGRIVPILSANDLVRNAQRAHGGADVMGRGERAKKARKTILVVDDSITTRTLEKSILEAAGYIVEVAHDGLQALERLATTKVDLVISDIEMPRMDGFALTESVKRDERTAKIPVILVSSLASKADKERGLKAGADAYVVKREFDQTVLLDTLNQLI